MFLSIDRFCYAFYLILSFVIFLPRRVLNFNAISKHLPSTIVVGFLFVIFFFFFLGGGRGGERGGMFFQKIMLMESLYCQYVL